MKHKIFIGICLLFILFYLPTSAQEKLRRSDSFFGWHFDFHATEVDKNLGENFDTELLDHFLRQTKPDYIQIDSKGHPGFSSYPTKVGYSADSFVKDPIRLWKDMADKHHIPLFVHYSGILDEKAIKQNPEWGRMNADGSRDNRRAGYLGKYSDELLIPQIKELIDRYQIDGAWIDGECWAALPDYSPEIVDDFLKKTELTEVPLNAKDPNYERWKQHNREVFKQYLDHYIDELHRYKPDFQITSNWAYSSRMPEPIDVDVDFLSGDVAGKNCIYSAAFESRCIALQGKPWDLMSWGMIPVNFWGGTHTPKPVIQLKQEAAEVLAMGGGYQVYFRQNRDGAFPTLDVDELAGLARFCRERQPYSHHSEIVPQIGMWFSLDGWKEENRESANIYGNSGFNQRQKGVLNLLLDGQHSVEILMDHHITTRMDQYPLIVIPEYPAFNSTLKDQLMNYVKNGGRLLIIGAKSSREFEKYLNVSFENEIAEAELMIGDKHLGGIAGLKTHWQRVKPHAGTHTIGKIYSQTDYRYALENPVATINSYGKGKIGAVYMDLSPADAQYRNPLFRNLLKQLVEELVSEITLQVQGSDEVHVVMSKKNGNTYIHLINSSGHHSNEKVFGYNELRPVPELSVQIKTDKRPEKILLQPAGKQLDFRFENGYVDIVVPPVEVYDIVEIVPSTAK